MIEPGLEFFASERSWRVFARSKDQWLIHSFGYHDVVWRIVYETWILEMLAKYRGYSFYE